MSKVNIDIKYGDKVEENVLNMVPSGGESNEYDAVIVCNGDVSFETDYVITAGTHVAIRRALMEGRIPKVAVKVETVYHDNVYLSAANVIAVAYENAIHDDTSNIRLTFMHPGVDRNVFYMDISSEDTVSRLIKFTLSFN